MPKAYAAAHEQRGCSTPDRLTKDVGLVNENDACPPGKPAHTPDADKAQRQAIQIQSLFTAILNIAQAANNTDFDGVEELASTGKELARDMHSPQPREDDHD